MYRGRVTNTQYVPILKGRAGEYAALRRTSMEDRVGMLPLVEIPPIPLNYETNRPATSVQNHIANTGGKLSQSWGTGAPILVDANALPDDGGTVVQHPLLTILNAARADGVVAVPVASTISSDRYLDAVLSAIADEGCAVRLDIAGSDENGEDVPEAVSRVIQHLEVDRTEVDLILDFGEIPQGSGTARRLFQGVLAEVGDVEPWRSLTVAATSFPVDLAAFDRDSASFVSRTEWSAWKEMVAKIGEGKRAPAFGDYTIANPVVRAIDPRIMQRSAQIRYTTDDAFLVIKGRSVKIHGSDQQHELARRLVSRAEFRGRDYSDADARIADCADETSGPGNAQTWREIGVGQHLAFVTREVAKILSP